MGWKQFGSVWYYFNTYTGSMASNGVYRINDKYYAFDANGAWITSNGWHKFSSPGGSADWIYMENGTICTGWKDIGGTWYYFSSPYGYMETGLVRIGGKISSFASSGAWIGYAAPGWQRINDSWYYVEGSAGDLATGWRTIGAYTYYFDTSNYYMYRSGTYTIGGKDYQFDYQGHLVS
jgi:glucan-binding YG repeat protein